jgi:hypothetical protein
VSILKDIRLDDDVFANGTLDGIPAAFDEGQQGFNHDRRRARYHERQDEGGMRKEERQNIHL